jgi:hypothetical protein
MEMVVTIDPPTQILPKIYSERIVVVKMIIRLASKTSD